MMDLILLERVEGLGNVGDEVKVRDGYGRNFLLPQNKAVVANASNVKVFERRRKVLEDKQAEVLAAAKAEAEKLSALDLVVIRATSDGKHLYGSIGATELAAMINEQGFDVARRDILLDAPIKEVGEHEFRVRLHPDVVAELKVNIEAEV
ncbi:50S ribosomal protein L9 [Ghiorsea bivora]|uniref:50S ribosomal protein L9 n=1 Tax=Ghiorsea bivora TaxID=1485545 RepID=UPI000A8CC0D4|nr:50S ribosomal protein L9 [Ghiorsea bivora]